MSNTELIERGREFARSTNLGGGKHLVSALCDALEPVPEPQVEPSDARVDAVAVAIAVAANADYWTDEIAEWENAESWEREAYPDNYPSTAYEDREEFRKQARAALRAATKATN